MAEQILEWSLDNEIYYRLPNIYEYSSRLGRIFNGEWHVKLIYTNLCLNPRLEIQLCAHKNLYKVKVEVIIYRGIRISEKETYYFNSRTRLLNIGNCLYNVIDIPVYLHLKFIRMDMPEKQESIIPEKSSLKTQIALEKVQKSFNPFNHQIPETSYLNVQIASEEIQKSIIPETSPLKAQIGSEESDLSYIKELAEDFQAMTFRENMSDITVICNSASFKVHKVILCARSPVFNAMFSSDMQEKATDTVTMDGMDPRAVRSMIQFIYSGQIHINSIAEATLLLDLSEQYQIQSLKGGLIKYFKSNLSLQNAIKILELADLYDQNLKENVIKFISTHFNTLKHEKNWKDLRSTKPSLAFEVYDNLN